MYAKRVTFVSETKVPTGLLPWWMDFQPFQYQGVKEIIEQKSCHNCKLLVYPLGFLYIISFYRT